MSSSCKSVDCRASTWKEGATALVWLARGADHVQRWETAASSSSFLADLPEWVQYAAMAGIRPLILISRKNVEMTAATSAVMERKPGRPPYRPTCCGQHGPLPAGWERWMTTWGAPTIGMATRRGPLGEAWRLVYAPQPACRVPWRARPLSGLISALFYSEESRPLARIGGVARLPASSAKDLGSTLISMVMTHRAVSSSGSADVSMRSKMSVTTMKECRKGP